jgi:rhamnosyltransferase
MKTVGIALITHNAKKHLEKCLPPLLKWRTVVVNSSSNDGTVEQAELMGAETLVIPRKSFNHGSTRELARKYLGTDIVVMMTPDAYATDEEVIDRLIAPILAGRSVAAYARQLPHEGAGFFEQFPRRFNYPAESHIRGLEDKKRYGPYTFFCSDSCAAYDNKSLDQVGGFPSVLIGEDTCVVAKLLNRGHKIAYQADATVCHSHGYGLSQEFKRHFDTGLARKQFGALIATGERDERRGAQYVKALVREIGLQRPHLLAYGLLQTAIKWIGYRIGRSSTNAPVWWKRLCSGQDFYWTSHDFLKL